MFKKFITMILVIVITVTASIGGTLAYFTDRDSRANVFTVGDVNIELDEAFDQDSTLVPAVVIGKDVWIKNLGPNEAWVWYTYAVPQSLDPHLTLQFDSQDDWINADTPAEVVEVDGIQYNVYVCLYKKSIRAGEETSVGLSSVKLNDYVDVEPDGQMTCFVNGTQESIGWNIHQGTPFLFVNAYAIQKQEFDSVQEGFNAFVNQWGGLRGEYSA